MTTTSDTTDHTPAHALLTRAELRADCSSCFALCCAAFGYSRSADFPIDKPAGSPCQNLASDFTCGIHAALRPRGFRGCTVFDCFGAGQAVSQRMFAGISWRDKPDTKQEMFTAFSQMKHLHEMLWYLAEATERTVDPETAENSRALARRIEAAMSGSASELSAVDLGTLHADVRLLLIEASEEVRAPYFAGDDARDDSGDQSRDAVLRPGADLMGMNLRSHHLCGADLRGAYLIGADLRHSDLTAVDLLGADLRDARLDGADLSRALYLTGPQINAARGDAATRLPATLSTPRHWLGG